MKHAYLIMVHKNNYNLEILLKLLDYEFNDIFIHVDKKCIDFNYPKYSNIVKKSKIFFTNERISVVWGGFSMVQAELLLTKIALDTSDYSYFHLLSGQCLPIKTQKYIHKFCDESNETCFLDLHQYDYSDCSKENKKLLYRASVNHYLQEYRDKFKFKFVNKFVIYIDRILIAIQVYVLRINKVKYNSISLASGANWFSLPRNAIIYIIEHEELIYSLFNKSSFCDELFMQTIFLNSEFKTRIQSNKRLVNFEKSNTYGHPYIWKENDLEEILNSDCFFARKFDEAIDYHIINLISQIITNQ